MLRFRSYNFFSGTLKISSSYQYWMWDDITKCSPGSVGISTKNIDIHECCEWIQTSDLKVLECIDATHQI